jgi:hypothetical protein
MTLSATTRVTYHRAITKPRRWTNPRTGGTHNARGDTGRHKLFAVSGGAMTNTWGPRHWVLLKLHSCSTWKEPFPHLSRASTEMHLGREEAEMMVVALMEGIKEFDKQVEEFGGETA